MSKARAVSTVFLIGAGGLFASAFRSPQQGDESAMTAKRAGEIFEQRCSTCHVAPDLAYATDRAWVEQIRETA